MSDYQITIINTMGQVVYSSFESNTSVFNLDISTFAQGMYFVNLIDQKSNGRASVKIIKK